MALDLSLTRISATPAASRTLQTSLCALVYSHATEPTTDSILLEADAAQSAKDDADENLPAVPPSTTATDVSGFWFIGTERSCRSLGTDHLSRRWACKYPTDLSYRVPFLERTQGPGPSSSLSFHQNECFENDVFKKTYVYREIVYSGDFV
ncbi:hypothetical protein DFH94DRAFT_192104 [Russula ochroleuca]|jgi:hypothetical protein|uniref:Uncharacterized protein n=1 Tax=Russula ochroleuca TaxID=152965 RepID=A0A9P5MQY3_9AGAM|nr:hypothetical protein DFH94DRAFT_192104 [Russula ochroleuca]